MTDPRDARLEASEPTAAVVIVMGVSGCGKSTVAELLAERLGGHFKDGDELHPPANIAKMSAGTSLTDEDREPWLRQVRDYAARAADEHGLCIVACSALKRRYRDTLRGSATGGAEPMPLVFHVYLQGTRALIASRMAARTGHFMPLEMLDSQIATLESPVTERRVVSVNVAPAPEHIARAAEYALRALDDFPTVSPEPT